MFLKTTTIAICALGLIACSQDSSFGHPECERGVCRTAGEGLPGACFAEQSTELFDERIKPLLAGNPDGTCIQCHLQDTGFAAYVREDACTTMACLMQNELVDLANPSSSHIIELINRAEPDVTEGGIITQTMIDAEADAFLQWIEASAACQADTCGEIVDPCSGGPVTPLDDGSVMTDAGVEPDAMVDCTTQAPRYCCGTPLVDSFRANVWANRGSCAPCHNRDLDLEDGEQNGLSYFLANGINRSLDNVLSWVTIDETNPGKSIINCDNPPQSLLILYPLLETQGGIFHGGGPKIAQVGSPGYNALLQFVRDYCACRGF